MKSARQTTRQTVLGSAIPVFACKGYAGASVVELMRATRLSKPTLYYYFGSKAGLFQSILDFAYDESFRLIQEAVAPRTELEEQLTAVARAMFEFTEANKDLMRLVLATLFAVRGELPPKSINPAKRRRAFSFVQQLIQNALDDGRLRTDFSAEELAHGVFGGISHHIRTHLLTGDEPLDAELARRIVRLFLNGARKRK